MEEERREEDVVDEGVRRVDESGVEEPVAAQDDPRRHHQENREDRLKDVQGCPPFFLMWGCPWARASLALGAPPKKIGRSPTPETARLNYAGKGVRTARPPPTGLLLAVRQDEVFDHLGRLDVGDPVGLLPLHFLDDARPLLFRLGAGSSPGRCRGRRCTSFRRWTCRPPREPPAPPPREPPELRELREPRELPAEGASAGAADGKGEKHHGEGHSTTERTRISGFLLGDTICIILLRGRGRLNCSRETQCIMSR